MTTLIHISLSLFLFILSNWIGRKSLGFGYYQISFEGQNNSPTFNILYRSFTPIVFIIIVSVIFYSVDLDKIVKNIYLVVVYYFIFRIIFNLIIGRSKLINWPQQIIIIICSIFLAYIVYTNLITSKEFFLPSKQEIATALWFALAAYLYKTLNNISIYIKSDENRKSNYVKSSHQKLSNEYKFLIDENTKNDKEKALVYSILIYENFNRHIIHRGLEKLLFFTGRIKTSGVMQFTSEKYLSIDSAIKY